MSNQIRLKRGSGSDPSASDLVVGEVALRTDNGKLFTKKDDNSIAEIGTGISDGDKGDLTISNSGGTFTIDNGAVTSAKILDGTIVGSDLATNVDLVDNQKLRLGNSQDLQIYHDGSHSRIDETGTGNLMIQSNNAVFIKKGTSENIAKFNVDGAVELYHDNKLALKTQSNHLELYGNIAESNIEFITGTSTLLTRGIIGVTNNGTMSFYTNDGTQKMALNLVPSGGVQLKHNAITKFETYSDGIKVIGQEGTSAALQLVADDGDDNGDTWELRSNQDDNDLTFKNNISGSNVDKLTLQNDGDLFTTGDVYLKNDSKRLKLGASEDLQIYHDGSQNIINGATGQNLEIQTNAFRVRNQADSESMIVANADSAVELYHDGSLKANTRSDGFEIKQHLTMGDSDEIRLGNSSDLKIYHDGTHSYIDNSTNNLYVNAPTFFQLGVSNGGEKYLTATENGAVELYHDNSKKFETTSGGATLTGTLLPGANNTYSLGSTSATWAGLNLGDHAEARFGNSADLKIYHDGSNSIINDNGTGLLQLQSGGNTKAAIVADGLQLYEHLYIEDNDRIKIGNSSDLQIYHDGSNSYIDDAGTGNTFIRGDDTLFIRGASNQDKAKFTTGGSVELYFDNSKKFETTSGGVLATGDFDSTTGIFERTSGFTSQLKFNTSNETQLIHGSNNQVKLSFVGFGNAARGFIDGQSGFIQIKTAADETGIICRDNSSTELHFDGSKKFETTTIGAKVTGDLDLSGGSIFLPDGERLFMGNSSDFQLIHNGTNSFIVNSTGFLDLQADAFRILTTTNETQAKFTANGAVELYFNNSKKFETTADGVGFNDNVKAAFGNGGDLKIFHDGSNSFIRNSTGGLDLNSDTIHLRNGANNETYARFLANGAAELYFNNSKKFETLGTGALVTGRFHVGTSTALINESSLSVKSGGNTCVLKCENAAGHNPLICWNNHGSGNRSQIQFGDGSSFSSRGSITTNGANVTYGGTSDYRRKQDDVSITDGIEKIKLLKPKRFKWKNNLDLGICDGFFAHEVQETIPTAHAVIGVKDEVDSDNNPVYQQIDQSKLVPLIVAALQEAIGRIEILETEVASLKAS